MTASKFLRGHARGAEAHDDEDHAGTDHPHQSELSEALENRKRIQEVRWPLPVWWHM